MHYCAIFFIHGAALVHHGTSRIFLMIPVPPISPQPPPNASMTTPTPLSMSTTLETPLETPGFTQKQPKTPVFNQNCTKPRKPTFLNENTTDLRDTTTYGTPFNYATHRDQETARTVDPYRLPTARSQPPASSGHEKRVPVCAVYESQPRRESPVPTIVAQAAETRAESVDFAKIHQNVENSTIFTQKATESLVLGHSKCMDEINTPPAPTTVVLDLKMRSEMAGFVKKPPETTPITNIRHFTIIVPVNSIPTSGKDPPHLAKSPSSIYKQPTKNFYIQVFSIYFVTVFFFLSFYFYLHIS
jgi:hypothetical protein